MTSARALKADERSGGFTDIKEQCCRPCAEAEAEAARLLRLWRLLLRFFSDESTALNKDTGKKALSRAKDHQETTAYFNIIDHVSVLMNFEERSAKLSWYEQRPTTHMFLQIAPWLDPLAIKFA